MRQFLLRFGGIPFDPGKNRRRAGDAHFLTRLPCKSPNLNGESRSAHSPRYSSTVTIPSSTLRLGTRASELALTQSGLVARSIEAASLSAGSPREVELVHITTRGDTDHSPLVSLGGSGVFVARLREALLAGEIDLAVHSSKDLPAKDAPGLRIAAFPLREDPRDVLCSRDALGLRALAEGARVGTGSPRRAAQILRLRPDLEVVDIRGNVPTRLRRISEDLDAVVLAAAGLKRLGLLDAVTEYLDPALFLPPAAQGALAVECREDADPELLSLLGAVEDPATRMAVTAERSLMNALDAGCAAPVGAWARPEGADLLLEAAVIAADGSAELRLRALAPLDSGVDGASRLGEELAARLLDAGAGRIADLHATKAPKIR